jgi:prephenate dehydrogenase
MNVHIAIIGMGQIGTSIGLALAAHKDLVTCTGFDRDPGIVKQALNKGALDRAVNHIDKAIREADLVILALPLDQLQETMKLVAPLMKENAVLMDTAPVKEAVADWAASCLLPGRSYVGFTPVISAAYLQEHESGLEAAHADLFRGGMVVIVAPPGTASGAIKQAADLSRLLGAETLFADPVEVDSFMSATHILPQLMAAALLNTTIDQPGWRESRKLAGRAYAEATSAIALLGDPGALSSAALLTNESVLRVTDSLIASLQALRNDIKTQNSLALGERLERARQGRDTWWKQRQAADWAVVEKPNNELPRGSDLFGRLMGMGRQTQKKR